MIAYSAPEVSSSGFWQFLKSALSKEFYSLAPVLELESEFAKYIGTKYAVAFGSGRYALTLCYTFFGCKSKKIIAPAYTCIPAIDAIRWVGAEADFVDISNLTYNPLFSPRLNRLRNLGAVSLSYLYGIVGDLTPFIQFAKRKKIPLIEDSAIALGGLFKGKKVGSIGDAGIFSLQSSKLVTAWRGGVVTTNNYDLYCFLKQQQKQQRYPSQLHVLFNGILTALRRVLSFSALYGVCLYRVSRLARSPFWSNFLTSILDQNPGEALNGQSKPTTPEWEQFRFTAPQAYLALSSMMKLDKILNKRKKIAAYYFSHLKNISGVFLPSNNSETVSTFGRFPIRIKEKSKNYLENEFRKFGVEIGMNYPYIIPQTTYFKNQKLGLFPNAMKSSKETILLPMHTLLSNRDLLHVVRAVELVACNI